VDKERLKADLATSREHVQQLANKLKMLGATTKEITLRLSEAEKFLNSEDASTQLPASLSQEIELKTPTMSTLAVPKSAPKIVAHKPEAEPNKTRFAARPDEELGGSPTQPYNDDPGGGATPSYDRVGDDPSDDDEDLRGGGGVDPQATQAYSPDSPTALKRKRQEPVGSEDELGDTDVDEPEGLGAQQSLATQKVSSLDSDGGFSQLGRKRQER